MNVLHWHLTEDQGWRLPIEAYPKLTEVGGFEPKPTARSMAALTAARHRRHRRLRGGASRDGRAGGGTARPHRRLWPLTPAGLHRRHLPVPHNWGAFGVYCAGNDSTMAFLKAVPDETCEMFPSEVIHIGGDEAPKVRWAECPKCQAKMAELGLHTEAELKPISSMKSALTSPEKAAASWGGMRFEGVARGGHGAVLAWHGRRGGSHALGHGCRGVPTSHCYLDYPLRSTDLEKAYNFVLCWRRPWATKAKSSAASATCGRSTRRGPGHVESLSQGHRAG